MKTDLRQNLFSKVIWSSTFNWIIVLSIDHTNWSLCSDQCKSLWKTDEVVNKNSDLQEQTNQKNKKQKTTTQFSTYTRGDTETRGYEIRHHAIDKPIMYKPS